MSKVKQKLVREGEYLAEVGVTLLESDCEWGPLLSLEDARKLDDVRLALRRGNLAGAVKLARVYLLTPIETAETA